jgi:predicted dehydrogenase
VTVPTPPFAELRLGLVGFGKLARDYYLPALRRLADTRVVAVADPRFESRRAALAGLHGVAVYSGHLAMLESARLNGVLVASPPSTHLEVWSDAISRGLPAFVEKPLLLAGQLGRLISANEPRLMIDFNRRFWPVYARVRDLVRGGALGRPVHLEFGLHLDVLRWSGVTRHRLDTAEGGLLHDLGSHAIDLALEVIGEEPDGVTATASSRQWTDDGLQLQLSFPSGSSARCDLAYGNRTREWLVAHGSEKTAHLAEPNMALHIRRRGTPRNRLVTWCVDAVTLGYRACWRSRSMAHASIRAALAAFIHALRTNGPFNPGFADGVRNARWVAAASRSAAAGGALEKT